MTESKKNSSSGYWSYANSFTYSAVGAVTSMQLGDGHWENSTFNDRLQVTQIGLGNTSTTQDLLKLDFEYTGPNPSANVGDKNNGSLRKQTITVPAVGTNASFAAIQAYDYDSLNRIQSATETVSSTQTWKQTFSYDRYGNRRFDTTGTNTTTIPTGCSTAVCNPTISTSNNRFSSAQGYSYDADGAVTQDATGQRFGYDSEDRQKEFFSATNSGSTPDATYSYDGGGQRVKKIAGNEVTVFVYDASGQLAAEYSTQIETANPKVRYLTTDHLGSPRIVTDQNGAVVSRKDFTAFGETVTSSQRVSGTNGNGYDAPNVRQDYTGYQKDEESGLEYAEARYYHPMHGRFTSVDPLMASGNPIRPQSWNRYTYSYNNPYKFTDPAGMMPGDYYSATGAYLGSDGKKDDMVYFASLARREGETTYVYTDSIAPTTIEEVNRARSFFTPSTPGTETEATQTLTGTVANSSIAGFTGISKGILNFGIDAVNTATSSINPVGAALGAPNPFAIPNIPGSNSLEQDYINSTKVGLALGTAVAGGTVGAGSSPSVVPEAPQLSPGASMITDLVGGPGRAQGQLNSAGDLVITGPEFKFRVDFRNPGGDAPHMHLEQFINGRWRDATNIHRIYPRP